MKFKIPNIAKGTVIPPQILKQMAEEETAKKMQKRQLWHDWIVAIVSCIIGFALGLLSNYLFNLPPQ